MSLDTSKPVRLKRAPEMVGTVSSVGPGALTITFAGGGTGRFNRDDIEQAPEGTQDKSWPPDLERK